MPHIALHYTLTLQYNTTPSNTQYNAIPYEILPYHATPCHSIPCHAIPYNTIQYNHHYTYSTTQRSTPHGQTQLPTQYTTFRYITYTLQCDAMQCTHNRAHIFPHSTAHTNETTNTRIHTNSITNTIAHTIQIQHKHN